MKLSNERFEIEIISKSEFVDDYSAENKKFLVTIWNIHVSMEALRNWAEGEISPFDFPFDKQEEYEVEFQRCGDKRREFEEKIEKILEQENINIRRVYDEFFTAIKIQEL